MDRQISNLTIESLRTAEGSPGAARYSWREREGDKERKLFFETD